MGPTQTGGKQQLESAKKEDAWRANVGWETEDTLDLVRKRTRDPKKLSWLTRGLGRA
ncbi:hypothetical protein TIFTF001_017871 [Ficus carica]|uniref:Uncharacterized protein n=1 Tax=Ficus carica TaxID=3494 RepID=A0AA88AM23_FICCA|nr:hypothetical protein TIFTF001_017871 [Ficus carica]